MPNEIETILKKFDEKSKDMLTHFSSDGDGEEYNNYLSDAGCYQELRTFISSHLTELLRGLISDLEGEKKELVVKDKIREYLGQGKYGKEVEINIRNPKMSEKEQDEAYGFNSALNIAQERIRGKLKE